MDLLNNEQGSMAYCWIGSVLLDRQCAEPTKCQHNQAVEIADLPLAKRQYYSEVVKIWSINTVVFPMFLDIKQNVG